MPRPPSTGAITSPYGMRLHPISGTYRMHNGEDTIGSGNYAPVTGTIIYAGYDTTGMGFGNTIAIQQTGTNVVWWMAHFANIVVKVGQNVTEGTYLGALGATGAATGPHVHTERRVGGTNRPGTGTPTDPRQYYTSTAGGGTTPLQKRKKSMTTLYWNGQPGASGAKWALAGDSPGTTANWIVTGTQALANAWAAVHGNSVNLGSQAAFDDFAKWYKQPINTTGGSSSGSVDISNLPTKGDLGQALTSTVALVNEHADTNRDQIIDAVENIPTATHQATNYTVDLNIDNIPGTATGTATPA